jgi:hypothetical protein
MHLLTAAPTQRRTHGLNGSTTIVPTLAREAKADIKKPQCWTPQHTARNANIEIKHASSNMQCKSQMLCCWVLDFTPARLRFRGRLVGAAIACPFVVEARLGTTESITAKVPLLEKHMQKICPCEGPTMGMNTLCIVSRLSLPSVPLECEMPLK